MFFLMSSVHAGYSDLMEMPSSRRHRMVQYQLRVIEAQKKASNR